jgi:hypothetical protein
MAAQLQLTPVIEPKEITIVKSNACIVTQYVETVISNHPVLSYQLQLHTLEDNRTLVVTHTFNKQTQTYSIGVELERNNPVIYSDQIGQQVTIAMFSPKVIEIQDYGNKTSILVNNWLVLELYKKLTKDNPNVLFNCLHHPKDWNTLN